MEEDAEPTGMIEGQLDSLIGRQPEGIVRATTSGNQLRQLVEHQHVLAQNNGHRTRILFDIFACDGKVADAWCSNCCHPMEYHAVEKFLGRRLCLKTAMHLQL